MSARNVVCGVVALLVLVSGSGSAADDQTNKQILRDALVGAVTGAVAAEATKDEAVTAVAAQEGKQVTDTTNKRKKKKHKMRPHGWDQGKKTGWGDGDVPPGLAKKES